MDKVRVGVVGLGHRGRIMFKLAADGFDFVVPALAHLYCLDRFVAAVAFLSIVFHIIVRHHS